MKIFVICSAIILSAGFCFGQSVVYQTVNLESVDTLNSGEIFFSFIHRFTISSAPIYKISNYPTFELASGILSGSELRIKYATNSEIAAKQPNEVELSAKFHIFELKDINLFFAVLPAYNFSSNSIDGVIPVEWRINDKVRTVINGFWLTRSGGRIEFIPGIGIIYLFEDNFSFAIDINNWWNKMVFGISFNIAILYSPHTVSFHATNAATSTIQGSTYKADDVRIGFEFTTLF